jgi:hypothetical protein
LITSRPTSSTTHCQPILKRGFGDGAGAGGGVLIGAHCHADARRPQSNVSFDSCDGQVGAAQRPRDAIPAERPAVNRAVAAGTERRAAIDAFSATA